MPQPNTGRIAQWAFYLPWFRVVEFTTGAALVWTERSGASIVDEALVPVGLDMIVLSAGLFDEETWFPGLSAMLPASGQPSSSREDKHATWAGR